MNREETLFASAVALPAAARGAYLDRECASDSALRKRLEELLHAHERASSLIPPADSNLGETVPAFAPRREETTGDMIGRYKLLQQIGEGGCGVVYMAEQTEPVVRRVALKVIKLGMDTKAVIGRFEAERQALAMMDHPNIAKVLDAGTTDNGRPFFVMELVRGVPITKYCDENKLATADRLALFDQVCHAIQHAHQKGIIHRDIKPSNILVTLHDGMPVPKVIDFGIAKATQGKLTDATVFTAFEQFIGTPAYMSPEQAEMSGLDIDTRSDIYSLGVLLYELLTGRPPFDPKSFVEAGLDEMRRMIREVEPPKPSTRLNTLTVADRDTVAKLRGTQSTQLRSQLSGDLDWIVMKALEKNRTRRYESASAFATDIQRHLHNEPVTARPPSAAYLIQKLIHRHKVGFAAAAAIAVALVLGLAFSTWSFLREKAARQRAVAAERQQVELRQQAEAARANEAKQRAVAEGEEKKAKIAAAKSEQAFRFMAGMLQGVGPSVAAGRDTTLVREILDKTVKRLDKNLQDQPEVDATLRPVLAGVYLDLGDFAQGETLARKALDAAEKSTGPDRHDVGDAKSALSMAVLMQGRGEQSETLAREALASYRQSPTAKDEDIASGLYVLGTALLAQGKSAEAEASLREALALVRRIADDDKFPLDAILTQLASALQKQGKLGEAEPMLREAIASQKQRLSPEHPMVGLSEVSLSNVLLMQGKLAEAEASFRAAYDLLKKDLGPDHPNLAMILPNLAMTVLRQGRVAEAESILREALALQEKTLGPKHPGTLQTLGGLSQILRMEGKTAEADQLQARLDEAIKGEPEADASAKALRDFQQGMRALQQHKFAEAEASFRSALPVLEKALPAGHQAVVGTRSLLVRAELNQGHFADAEATASAQVAALRKDVGNDSSTLADALLLLAMPLEAQQKFPEAATVLSEALAISRRQTAGGSSASIAGALLRLAAANAELGKNEEADKLVAEAAAMSHPLPTPNREQITAPLDGMLAGLIELKQAEAAVPIARVYLAFQQQADGEGTTTAAWGLTTYAWVMNAAGHTAEGEKAAREAAAIRRKILSPDDWLIAVGDFYVGESLFKQKKYPEAEAVLLAAFAGLQKSSPAKSEHLRSYWRDRLRYSAGYLQELYEATNQPDKAAEWKKNHDELAAPEPPAA